MFNINEILADPVFVKQESTQQLHQIFMYMSKQMTKLRKMVAVNDKVSRMLPKFTNKSATKLIMQQSKINDDDSFALDVGKLSNNSCLVLQRAKNLSAIVIRDNFDIFVIGFTSQALAIRCNVTNCDNLTLLTPGTVRLMGDIFLKQQLKVFANGVELKCEIKNNTINPLSISAARVNICALTHLYSAARIISKKVVLAAHGINLSTSDIYAEHQAVLLATNLYHETNLTCDGAISIIANSFKTDPKSSIVSQQDISLTANKLVVSGSVKTNSDLHLNADNLDSDAFFFIGKDAQIITKKDLKFERAHILHYGNLLIKSGKKVSLSCAIESKAVKQKFSIEQVSAWRMKQIEQDSSWQLPGEQQVEYVTSYQPMVVIEATSNVCLIGSIDLGEANCIIRAKGDLAIKGRIDGDKDNNNSLQLEANNITIDNNLNELSQVYINTSPAGALKINKPLFIQNLLSINADSCQINSSIYINNGLISISVDNAIATAANVELICETTKLSGHSIVTDGSLIAKSVVLESNEKLINNGRIIARQLSLVSSLVVNLNHMAAKSLDVKAIVSVQAWHVYSPNYRCNAIIELTCGLALPYSLEYEDIFTQQNLIQSAKMLLAHAAPAAKNTFQALFQGFNLINYQLPALYQQIQEIQKRRANGETGMPPLYKIIPLIVSMKDIGMACYNLKGDVDKVLEQSNGIELDAGKFTQAVNECADSCINGLDSAINNPGDVLWSNAGTVINVAATVLGPKYSSEGVFSYSFGMIASGNVYQRSLYATNNAITFALNSLTMDVNQLTNNAVLYSLFGTNISGDNYQHNGLTDSLYNGVKLNVTEDVCFASSLQQQHSNWRVAAKRVRVEGVQDFADGYINSEQLEVSVGAECNNKRMRIEANNANINGNVRIEECTVNIDEVDIVATNGVAAVGSSVTGKLINQAGTFTTDHCAVKFESGTITGETLVDNSSWLTINDANIQQGSLEATNGSLLSINNLNIGGKLLINNSALKPVADEENSVAGVGIIQICSSGQLVADESAIGDYAVNNDGGFHISNAELMSTQAINNNAGSSFKTDNVIINAATLQTDGTWQLAKQTHITVDHIGTSVNSQLQQLLPEATLSLTSKTEGINGQVKIDNLVCDIEQVRDLSAFIAAAGPYNQFEIGNHLALATTGHVDLNSATNLQCTVQLTTASIDVNQQLHSQGNVILKATDGDINYRAGVTADNGVYANATGNMTNHGQLIKGSEETFLEAEGIFTNIDGVIDGKLTVVKGSQVINQRTIHTKSAIINGQETYVTATEGNIENQGGIIRGENYLYGHAKGDIINSCMEWTEQGAFSPYQRYEAGQLLGGAGLDDNEVGLYLHADAKIINDASRIASKGFNYIDAEKGYVGLARTSNYVVSETTKKGWFGKKKHEVTVGANYLESSVVSESKRNIITSEDGGIVVYGANFIAPEGTDLIAKDDINLYAMHYSTHTTIDKKSWFGISKSHQYNFDNLALPTLFMGDGFTNIHSHEGNVHGKGAMVLGATKLDTRGKYVAFDSEILDHSFVIKQQSLGASILGYDLFGGKQNNPSSFGQWLGSIEPIIGKGQQLINSQNTPEWLANSMNAGIATLNAADSIIDGIRGDNIGGTLLSRYGLGDSNGFNPTVNLSMTKTKTTGNYQTLGPGMIQCESWNVVAEEEFRLGNGIPVDVSGDMTVTAKVFTQSAAKLVNNTDFHQRQVTLGVTASGDVVDVGAAYSSAHSYGVNHENQQLNVGGRLTVNADTHNLHGANTSVNALTYNVGTTNVISLQDTSHSHSKSISASTSGNVSFSKTHSDSAIVNQQSGISVHGDYCEGNISNLNLVGGYFQEADGSTLVVDNVSQTEVNDFSRTRGFGFSGNISTLLPSQQYQQQQQPPSGPAISTFNVNAQTRDYLGTNHASMFGKNAANQSPPQLHTVTRDRQLNLSLDVPIINQARLEQTMDNFAWAGEKLTQQFSSTATSLPIEPMILQQCTLNADSDTNPEETIALPQDVALELNNNEPVIAEVSTTIDTGQANAGDGEPQGFSSSLFYERFVDDYVEQNPLFPELTSQTYLDLPIFSVDTHTEHGAYEFDPITHTYKPANSVSNAYSYGKDGRLYRRDKDTGQFSQALGERVKNENDQPLFQGKGTLKFEYLNWSSKAISHEFFEPSFVDTESAKLWYGATGYINLSAGLGTNISSSGVKGIEAQMSGNIVVVYAAGECGRDGIGTVKFQAQSSAGGKLSLYASPTFTLIGGKNGIAGEFHASALEVNTSFDAERACFAGYCAKANLDLDVHILTFSTSRTFQPGQHKNGKLAFLASLGKGKLLFSVNGTGGVTMFKQSDPGMTSDEVKAELGQRARENLIKGYRYLNPIAFMSSYEVNAELRKRAQESLVKNNNYLNPISFM